ncbi:MAG: GlsB/YeaQ/YmgE family stress response membrane protein [Solobacterium sp.]|nr:GlsB/YeaQ/YmgE family stress response membrane protein [Solobacterium sp.]
MILSLIYFLIVGLAAGYIATRLLGLNSNDILTCLVIGVIGSFVGGLIGSVIGLQATGMIGKIIMSVIGACVSLWVYRRFIRKY